MTSLMSLGVAEMSNINRGTIWARQDLRLAGPGHVMVPLTAELYYSRQDPYAVRMSFDVGKDEPVEWTFDRGLLAAALHAPEGIGDIRVWPSAASAPAETGAGTGQKILNIVLGPRAGTPASRPAPRESRRSWPGPMSWSRTGRSPPAWTSMPSSPSS